jgi:hypothetical protein
MSFNVTFSNLATLPTIPNHPFAFLLRKKAVMDWKNNTKEIKNYAVKY